MKTAISIRHFESAILEMECQFSDCKFLFIDH